VRLAGLIATANLPPRPRVLELGCGTGHLTERLRTHLPGARILATDIAPAMVDACRLHLAQYPQIDYTIMDARRPASTDFYDLICANLAVQWLPDLPDVLQRLAQQLAPGGLLAVSLLGDATFAEWRAAHTRLGFTSGTLPFPAAEAVTALFPAGGRLNVQCETWIDRPASALDFLRSLRAIGADTAAPGHTPLSATQLRRVLYVLGTSPAMTYQLVYALWCTPDAG
jgi:malonyl-CoA O-methyltransferase